MSKPGALLPSSYQVFMDATGVIPLASGLVQFYAAGSTTPQSVYHDADLGNAWTNPVGLDSGGGATIYLSPLSYKVKIMTSAGAVVRTIDDVYDLGQLAMPTATLAASGGSALVGYKGAATTTVARTVQAKLRELEVSPEDFGAVRDGVTDDLAAFQAMTTYLATTTQAGGRVRLLEGQYYLSGTWDTTAVNELVVHGPGYYLCLLRSGATTTAGMIVGGASNTSSWFGGFNLRRHTYVGGTIPAASSGNYGITTPTGGDGAGLVFDGVRVDYFGDHAFRIGGPTGPTVLRDCYAYYCEGYGVAIVTLGGSKPQDVKIDGGAIQAIRGGVLINASTSCHITDCDIELGTQGLYPAVYGKSGSVFTMTDVTVAATAGATTTPAGLVVCESSAIGCVIVGGINNANNGTNNLLMASSGVVNTTIVGGYYANADPGGYFCSVAGGTNTTVINPFLTATYQSGKNIINDIAANFVTAIGVPCTSAVGSTTDSMVISKLPVLSLIDGVTAPATVSGKAQIYVDTADGDLKVKFGDGFVATLAVDS